MSDNHSLCELWRWRRKALQDVRLNKGCTYSLDWLRHPRCTLRHDLAHHVWVQSAADVAWQVMVKRCRKEITFYEQIKDVEKKDAARFMARIARHDIFMLFLDLKQFFPAIKRNCVKIRPGVGVGTWRGCMRKTRGTPSTRTTTGW